MINRSLPFWLFTLFLALSAAMMLVPAGDRVSTLEDGLGPVVETQPL